MTARAVGKEDFDREVLQNTKTVLVDFWAEWCGQCRNLAPILDELASQHADKLDVVKLDVDENPELALKFQVISLPALKVFKEGDVVHSSFGAKSKTALEGELADFLS